MNNSVKVQFLLAKESYRGTSRAWQLTRDEFRLVILHPRTGKARFILKKAWRWFKRVSIPILRRIPCFLPYTVQHVPAIGLASTLDGDDDQHSDPSPAHGLLREWNHTNQSPLALISVDTLIKGADYIEQSIMNSRDADAVKTMIERMREWARVAVDAGNALERLPSDGSLSFLERITTANQHEIQRGLLACSDIWRQAPVSPMRLESEAVKRELCNFSADLLLMMAVGGPSENRIAQESLIEERETEEEVLCQATAVII